MNRSNVWAGIASPTCDVKNRPELPQEDFDDLVTARSFANRSNPAVVICHRYETCGGVTSHTLFLRSCDLMHLTAHLPQPAPFFPCPSHPFQPPALLGPPHHPLEEQMGEL